MKCILSPAAIGDLQSISNYTLQHWGAEKEDRYFNAIWEKFVAIQSDPSLFSLREDLVTGCRSAHHGKHVIFFAVQGQTLRIIRIFHGAMDFRTYLPYEDLPD